MNETIKRSAILLWGLSIIAVTLPLFITPNITLDHFLLPKHCLFIIGCSLWLMVRFCMNRQASPALAWIHPLADPLIVFCLFYCFSTFQFVAAATIYCAAFVLLFAPEVFRQASARDRERPFEYAALAGFVVAVYAIFQDYGYDFINYAGAVPDWRGRIVSTLGNPNHVGGYVALVLPYALVRMLVAKETAELAAWGLMALVLIAALTAVFTVGVWIGVFLSILLTPFLVRYLSIRIPCPRRMWIIPCLFAAVFAFYFTDNPYNPRGESQLRQAASSMRWKTGAGARGWIWGVTAQMVREHPLLGVGEYIRVYQLYAGRAYAARTSEPHDRPYVSRVDHAHSEIYEVFAVAGAFAGCALLWAIFVFIKLIPRSFKQCPEDERPLLYACLVSMIILSSHTFTEFPWHLAPNAFMGILCIARITSFSLRPPKPTSYQLPPVPFPVRIIMLLLMAACAVFVSWDLFQDSRLAKRGLNTILPSLAESYLERGTSYPARADNLSVYAEWLFTRERYADALPVLESWDKAEANMGARLYLSMAHEKLGHKEEAAAWMRKVLEVNPTWPAYLQQLARLSSAPAERRNALQRAALFWDRLRQKWLRQAAESANPAETGNIRQQAREAGIQAAASLEALAGHVEEPLAETCRELAAQLRANPLDPSTGERLGAMLSVEPIPQRIQP